MAVCPKCNGEGLIDREKSEIDQKEEFAKPLFEKTICDVCGGSGQEPKVKRVLVPKFELTGLHKDYDGLPQYFSKLCAKYPFANLKLVKTYVEPKDESLAFVDGGTINLNLFWFSLPKVILQNEAKIGSVHRLMGISPWHANMEEPDHVLTHEFGHVVDASLSNNTPFKDFTTEKYKEVQKDPTLAATGYAIYNKPEWFAETFACMNLKTTVFDRNKQTIEMRAFFTNYFPD